MRHISHALKGVREALEEGPWVNAQITLTVPLSVPVEASDEEKDEALRELHEELVDALPSSFEGCVSSGEFEDVEALGGAA